MTLQECRTQEDHPVTITQDDRNKAKLEVPEGDTLPPDRTFKIKVQASDVQDSTRTKSQEFKINIKSQALNVEI